MQLKNKLESNFCVYVFITLCTLVRERPFPSPLLCVSTQVAPPLSLIEKIPLVWFVPVQCVWRHVPAKQHPHSHQRGGNLDLKNPSPYYWINNKCLLKSINFAFYVCAGKLLYPTRMQFLWCWLALSLHYLNFSGFQRLKFSEPKSSRKRWWAHLNKKWIPHGGFGGAEYQPKGKQSTDWSGNPGDLKRKRVITN